jgi:hypothetical protein
MHEDRGADAHVAAGRPGAAAGVAGGVAAWSRRSGNAAERWRRRAPSVCPSGVDRFRLFAGGPWKELTQIKCGQDIKAEGLGRLGLYPREARKGEPGYGA